MKKIAVIQDISGLGRCSLSAALPVLSVMGLQCLPIPTAVYTNQTGFSRFAVLSCEQLLGEFPVLWQEHGVVLDGIYTGFMASREQLAAAQRMINTFRRDETLVLIDPVMGDNGSRYPGFDDELCRAIAAYAAQADVITPNVTEALLLAGGDIHGFMRAPPKEQEAMLQHVCETLPQPRVVITGWRRGQHVCNAAWDNGRFAVYASPAVAGSYSGTGDLFASAVCGGLAKGDSLGDAIRRATRFLEAALQSAAQAGAPEEEGVPFERHLKELLH